jgi:hypothetical protein
MSFDINAIVRTIKRKDKGLRDPQLIFPDRDWFIGVVVTVLIVVSGGALSVYQYWRYTTVDFEVESDVTLVPYRAAQVAAALEKYQAKLQLHSELKGEVPSQTPAILTEGENENSNILDAPISEPTPPALIEETATNEVEIEISDPETVSEIGAVDLAL